MEKSKLRQRVTQQLQALAKGTYDEKCADIHQQLLQSELLVDASVIALTISTATEVNTKPLIQALWERGKKVAVPKCSPHTNELTFYCINDFSQLETVYLDLQEPIPDQTVVVHANEIDLIIVPGIAYNWKGYRIGYGGGYYDRYLQHYEGKKIALAFEFQVLEHVPTESHDIPVDALVTEQQLVSCQHNREGLIEQHAVND